MPVFVFRVEMNLIPQTCNHVCNCILAQTKTPESNYHRSVNFRTHCDIDRHLVINLHLISQAKVQILRKKCLQISEEHRIL
jgi:hypothetical protein